MSNKKLFLIYSILLILNPLKVKAGCDFKTGEFIQQLSSPNYIEDISISIPDSKKFVTNSLKILKSEGKSINPKFRKKYNANIQVRYPFGQCEYKAKVWQNGDWKDHIKWNITYPLTSLNVKLKEGNILNAVKFKLLIPQTRNGINEILGTVILKNLGFISPETFEAEVSINGNKNIMIFQEDSRKELLERNHRREGPIFEGDESILWGNYNNKKLFAFEHLSLSRLINWKWFLKGESSQMITLNSYTDLQNSYLPKLRLEGDVISPNFKKNNHFKDFYFLMSTMNGYHALRPHNRKFYFNSLQNTFEPIYYDGNFQLEKEINLSNEKLNFSNALSNQYYSPHLEILQDKIFQKNIKEQFKARVINFDIKKSNFFENSIANIIKNSNLLINYLNSMGDNYLALPNVQRSRFLYKDLMKNKELDQKIIKAYKIIEDKIEILLDDNTKENLSLYDFSRILSKNSYKNKRYIFLPVINNKANNDLNRIFNIDLNGEIITSPKIEVSIDKKNRIIKITQLDPDSWILFKDLKLTNWDIRFFGRKYNFDENIKKGQRFNRFGITGCLNFFRAEFDKSSIQMNNGGCEDSVNIIGSTGIIEKINVHNAIADAIDLDFSDLKIKNLYVNSAGNDCFDVSGGIYSVINGNLAYCNDKGLSIGESSIFTMDNISINKSLIGISVKDFSEAKFIKSNITNSKICIEAKQKKQEFGGAYVKVGELFCDASSNNLDNNSIISFKKYEL